MTLPQGLITDIMKYLGPTRFPDVVPYIHGTKFARNTNDIAVNINITRLNRYFSKHGKYPGWISWFESNNNSIAVRWSIKNQEHINFEEFYTNTNTIAVNWIIENNRMHDDCSLFEINENPIAVQWYINNPTHITADFSANHSPMAIKWLIDNPAYIDEETFAGTPNKLVIKWLIDNNKMMKYYKNLNRDIDNDDYVNWLIDNDMNVDLNQNPNDIAVSWLINNPDKISKTHFVKNTNTMAVQYFINSDTVLDGLNSLDNNMTINFINNVNPLVSQYLIDKKINTSCLFYRSDNIAVDEIMKYLIDIGKKIPLDRYEYIEIRRLSSNIDPRIVTWLIEHPTFIDWDVFTGNPNCICMDDRIKKELRLV